MEILRESRLQRCKVHIISPTRDEPYSDSSAMDKMTLAHGSVMTLHDSGCKLAGQCSGFNLTSQCNAKSEMTCSHPSQLPATFQRPIPAPNLMCHVLPLPLTATTSYHLRTRQRF